MNPTSKKGGARRGAGRPALGHIEVNIRLSPEARTKLFKTAGKLGLTRSQVVENLILNLF